ncbi:hypothetical protein DNU06_10475 [Putridiphycobacter roseus]|uniref:Secretion system C-terminal sorting domain-containing protein n=1 Tax=Putridiphycobacter roseus TaxID=2219161 RepID=A0A2W1NR48_9FLAO|nr:T9SS type A sorting domain-containing protein [Putridiphycobacter roseus]PZE17158.1 hypothetical protein DNU06_10475 [Putridiphycobacter roseus]
MKIVTLFLLILFFRNDAQSQALTVISNIVSEPFCRTTNYQNGYGLLNCVVTGGSGNHYIDWTNPEGLVVSHFSNLSIPKPGLYVLEVFDTISGAYFIDSMMVDSINPEAVLNIVSNGLTDLGNDAYEGNNSVNVTLENHSTGSFQVGNPLSDTIFYWNLDTSITNGFIYTFDMNPIMITYEVGVYDVTLIAKNYNDCTDTAHAKISIYSTAGNLATFDEVKFQVIANYQGKYINVVQASNNNANIQVFNMQGQLMATHALNNTETFIPFNHPQGVYIYQVTQDSKVVYKEKFLF